MFFFSNPFFHGFFFFLHNFLSHLFPEIHETFCAGGGNDTGAAISQRGAACATGDSPRAATTYPSGSTENIPVRGLPAVCGVKPTCYRDAEHSNTATASCMSCETDL